MSEVLVIGHRNPDTDAICSAIGYAEYKRRTGMPEAVAARCGDTNDRIDFVLQSFGVPPPRFVPDVSPKVRDVMATNVVSVPIGTTAAEAMSVLESNNIRVLPVMNTDGSCAGLLSVFKLNKFFFPVKNRLFDSRQVQASLKNIAETLTARVLVGKEMDREEDLVLMVGAMNLESFAKRLTQYPADRLVVLVGDRLEIQDRAIREKVRAVIVTGDLEVSHSMEDYARKNEVTMIISPHDSVTSAMLCRAAINVRHMMHEKLLFLYEDDPLDKTAKRAMTSNFLGFPVLNAEHKMSGFLSKTDFLKRVERKLILVDHNELSQAVPGAETIEIIEIIDHHRIGTHVTAQPILFRNEPVGSTSTIVADCFFRDAVPMPKEIAGLLLAGLVSDTLNLTSPTTTAKDREILARLEVTSGVKAKQFTEKLFTVGSVLVSKPAPQAITSDCKEYKEGGKVFSVAQIEEIGFEQFWKRKLEVLHALSDYQLQRGYFFAALLVTDVDLQTSLLLVAGSSEFLSLIQYDEIDKYPELECAIYELPGIVSRKKQLLPFLAHCLKQL
ncbi:MAG: putative manganese-dependent inorganic diphosphatase [Verrucomicrobia bacterium]|nr:putative manganese-dependent inorganic diphosphatase [Verrucomicrobiota bacterium]MBI3867101.1 putative manganese-dependent inorganic diphosphatase [Verrucomicrobiota bacterium]